MHTWLLLHYKIPREPSSSRVYIWRKLKRLGAVLLHDAIWVLPATPRTTEQFQWLAAEISELEGEAVLWQTQLVAGGSLGEESLLKEFTAQVEALYSDILGQLELPTPDLAALSRQYQKAHLQDYFHSELGSKVREKLIAAGSGNDSKEQGKEVKGK